MFSSVAPGGLLGEFVSSLWLQTSPGQDPGAELRLPTGTVELVVNLAADRFWLPDDAGVRRTYPAAIVAGPYRHAYVMDTAQQSHVVGVVCRPGRARALVDAPLHELSNRHVALEDLWGADATRVRERMLAAPDAATRLRVLESALCARLTGSAHVAHPLAAAAAGWLSRVPEYPGVGELGDRAGLTSRRVQQVFRTEVGLSPKSYQRLRRFRSVLAGIDEVERVGWSAFASECGYYDQAHLVREFRDHSGLSPTGYLRARGEQTNHVPLPG
jgi:AraC-like DNA-binding protein